MNKKLKIKIVIDSLMTVMLLFLMARQITGDSIHEWLGAGIMVLWIAHHILNRNWYGNLFRGKYTSVRVLQMIINIVLFLSMLGLMISGIILSREIFVFLPISGGIAFARSLHIVSAFWGFVLMALHLGLHWNMILGIVRKASKKELTNTKRIILRIAAVFIAGYGVYAFIKNQLLAYMFLTSSFVFFDFEKPIILFFTEYIAIMGLFVFVAHYVVKGIQMLSGRRKRLAEKSK